MIVRTKHVNIEITKENYLFGFKALKYTLQVRPKAARGRRRTLEAANS